MVRPYFFGAHTFNKGCDAFEVLKEMTTIPTRGTVEDARRLAWFLHGDENIAALIVERAVMAWGVAAEIQERRDLSNARRAVLPKPVLLQRLVLEESIAYERKQEAMIGVSGLRPEDLALRYMEYLLVITMQRNSFYTTVGFLRLLYDYAFEATQSIYECVNYEDFINKDEVSFRKRKKLLFDELRKRFKTLLREEKREHGDLRFTPDTPVTERDREAQIALVRECSEQFKPWSTQCPISAEGCDGGHAGLNSEAQRMHSVVHHSCLSELLVLAKRGWSARHSKEPGRANDLFAAPYERLSLPRFFRPGDNMKNKDNTSGPGASWSNTSDWLQHRGQPPTTQPGMLNHIQAQMDEARAIRRSLVPETLNAYVDGELRGTIDLQSRERATVHFTEFDRWLRVAAPTPTGEVLLGVFSLASAPVTSAPAELILEGGQRLTLQLRPDALEESRGTATIVYSETTIGRRLRWAWTRLIRSIHLPGTRPLMKWAAVLRVSTTAMQKPAPFAPALVGAITILALIIAPQFFRTKTPASLARTAAEPVVAADMNRNAISGDIEANGGASQLRQTKTLRYFSSAGLGIASEGGLSAASVPAAFLVECDNAVSQCGVSERDRIANMIEPDVLNNWTRFTSPSNSKVAALTTDLSRSGYAQHQLGSAGIRTTFVSTAAASADLGARITLQSTEIPDPEHLVAGESEIQLAPGDFAILPWDLKPLVAVESELQPVATDIASITWALKPIDVRSTNIKSIVDAKLSPATQQTLSALATSERLLHFVKPTPSTSLSHTGRMLDLTLTTQRYSLLREANRARVVDSWILSPIQLTSSLFSFPNTSTTVSDLAIDRPRTESTIQWYLLQPIADQHPAPSYTANLARLGPPFSLYRGLFPQFAALDLTGIAARFGHPDAGNSKSASRILAFRPQAPSQHYYLLYSPPNVGKSPLLFPSPK